MIQLFTVVTTNILILLLCLACKPKSSSSVIKSNTDISCFSRDNARMQASPQGTVRRDSGDYYKLWESIEFTQDGGIITANEKGQLKTANALLPEAEFKWGSHQVAGLSGIANSIKYPNSFYFVSDHDEGETVFFWGN